MRDFQTLFRLRRVSLAQLLEARLLVEPETARLAALRATDADVKALRAALDERAEHTAAGRHARLLDSEFHRLVAEAARNPVHSAVTQALMDLEVEVVPKLDLGVDGSRALDAAHREILDAILARQPERAGLAMERHIRDIEERLGGGAQERAAS
jgi:DNA-binding FadR family transcriptional regulator